MVHGVDHRARPQEEAGLEEGVRHQVKHAGHVRPHPHRREHEAELRHGGVRQHLLDVPLLEADGGGEDRRQRSGWGSTRPTFASVWHWAIPTQRRGLLPGGGPRRAGWDPGSRDPAGRNGRISAGWCASSSSEEVDPQERDPPTSAGCRLPRIPSPAPSRWTTRATRRSGSGSRSRSARGCCELEPAPGGRLLVKVGVRPPDPGADDRSLCRVAPGPGLARLPGRRGVQLLRSLPPACAARPLRRLDPPALKPLLRRLRGRDRVAGSGDPRHQE